MNNVTNRLPPSKSYPWQIAFSFLGLTFNTVCFLEYIIVNVGVQVTPHHHHHRTAS